MERITSKRTWEEAENDGVHGCRVLREAADRLDELQRENDALFRAAMDNRKESGLTDD